jgi:hypothetical protein
MVVHTTEQRAFIVGALAAYVSPDTIVQDFATRWRNTVCARSDVMECTRDQLNDDWRAYFDREREAFLNAPTADRRVRLGELHRLFVTARDRGASGVAAELLEQIAKEQSGYYAGKGGVSGNDAVPDGELITSITRTIVDPLPALEPVT